MVWAVAKAKARFSELVESAHGQGPQQITRNGKLVGVLVSPEEWEKKNKQPAQNARTMSEFFRSSPLVGSGIDLRRSRSKARKVEL
jgi:prevent-host-death family protein